MFERLLFGLSDQICLHGTWIVQIVAVGAIPHSCCISFACAKNLFRIVTRKKMVQTNELKDKASILTEIYA